MEESMVEEMYRKNNIRRYRRRKVVLAKERRSQLTRDILRELVEAVEKIVTEDAGGLLAILYPHSTGRRHVRESQRILTALTMAYAVLNEKTTEKRV